MGDLIDGANVLKFFVGLALAICSFWSTHIGFTEMLKTHNPTYAYIPLFSFVFWFIGNRIMENSLQRAEPHIYN